MDVLVVGGGGREHALCWKLSSSRRVSRVFCAPGNAGTSEIAENVPIDPTNIPALLRWAKDRAIELTVVGPEAPLAAGIVDVFEETGLGIFGPRREAAELESSKAFAKEIMESAGVPTARGRAFSELDEARSFVERSAEPLVVKADGLAAGKGVIIPKTKEDTLAAVEDLLGGRLGESGRRVVLEEFISGREASVIGVVDGTSVVPFAVSQDYKRIGEGDTGPNTGGMGAISPTPVLPDGAVREISERVFVPVLAELSRRSIHYRGFLYAGLIIDEFGAPYVLEFNCRLGDPETQVLLPRMRSDLLDLILGAVEGRLDDVAVEWREEAAACVVASSRGYPEKAETGKPIQGLSTESKDSLVFHAGTRLLDDGQTVVSSGGRVLSVTALGKTKEEALRHAYARMEQISFDGMYYRRDIGRT